MFSKIEMEIRKKIYIVLMFFFLASVLQCTPKKQIIKEDDEAALKRRFQEYWSYKIRGQWDKAYVYESPDYRGRVAVSAYAIRNARSIVKWQEFNIIEVWTTGEEGYVKVDRKYRYLIPQTNKAVFNKVVEEKWIKKDGEWFRSTS
jgi:hypothetical protein